MLNTRVADGRCVIEAVLAPEAESSSVSYQDAFLAALLVIRGCILNRIPTQGGLAKDIGKCFPGD